MPLVRSAPPSGLTESLHLPPSAKVLQSCSVGLGSDGQEPGWLVVTNQGLAVGLSGGLAPLEHTDWVGLERLKVKRQNQVAKRGAAAWLTIYLLGQDRPLCLLLPNQAKRIASLINERFQASLVTVEYLDLPGGRLRAALRRNSSDQLEVQVFVPPELDEADPKVTKAISLLCERLSEGAGGLAKTW